MNRNKKNNVACTALKDKDIVIEKYNDSNSCFISFLIEVSAGATATVNLSNASFTGTKLNWGDQQEVNINTSLVKTHTYPTSAEKRNYWITIKKCTKFNIINASSAVISISGGSIVEISIGKGIKLNNSVFKNLSTVKIINGLDLNENLNNICNGCTNLEKVDIGGDTFEIGPSTFVNCNSKLLTNDLVKNIYIFQENAFSGVINEDAVTTRIDLKLPKAVFIDNNVFSDTKLHIELGRKDILFLHKTATLTGAKFYYPGTQAEFNSYAPNDLNDVRKATSGKTVTILYYSETQASGCWRYVENKPTAW